ncbi:hypothetical protein OHV10_23750 [Vibrio splendidus]|uniref:hypothetical protein n=1 Tax=Vibrio splendidus TaxID=29497 RepID=UPI0022355864|nr:hypothetical protein [Vibrio splendidus]MCW4447235.1 hypothetical protein [Vibrio splendidus]
MLMEAIKNKKLLSTLITTLAITACGGGGTTDSGNNNSGDPSIMPYSAERVTQVTQVSLGSEFQYMNETDDNLCSHELESNACEYYSYGAVAYNLSAEVDAFPSLDDVATTVNALDSYVVRQAELWGYSNAEDLIAAYAIGTSQVSLDVVMQELIAYDLQREDNAESTIIDSSVLSDARAFFSIGDTCTDLGGGALTENHCAASRYMIDLKDKMAWESTANTVLREVAVQYDTSTAYYDNICTYVSADGLTCVSSSTNAPTFENIAALFGADKTKQITVAGFSYDGGTNKGLYGNLIISAPNNLSAYPDFDAKVMNHELTHLFADAFSSNGTLQSNSATFFMTEGVAVLFSQQQVWTWDYFASEAGSGSAYLLGLATNYKAVGSLMNYLLVATTKAEAMTKHNTFIDFLKMVKTSTDVEAAFDSAGFTDHKGRPLTLAFFEANIASLVIELANDTSSDSYKSVAYNDFK